MHKIKCVKLECWKCGVISCLDHPNDMSKARETRTCTHRFDADEFRREIWIVISYVLFKFQIFVPIEFVYDFENLFLNFIFNISVILYSFIS